MNGIPFKIHARGWRILSETAMANSLFNISAELITNSIDSYDRLSKQGVISPKHEKEVFIEYKPGTENGFYMITDQAEGMTSEKLEENITEYGKETSGEAERGLFGFGLKDVCIAMDEAKVISIKNNKISEYEIKKQNGNPILLCLKKDEKVTSEERGRFGIKNNGTCIVLTVPERFNRPNFITFFKQLRQFYPLRKIFQDENILTFLIDKEGKFDEPFRTYYEEPKNKILLKKDIKLNYGKHSLNLNLIIKLAEKELEGFSSFRSAFRQNGLLVFYGKHAVIDCTLFGYDFEPYARNIFGEIEIQGKFKEALKEEPEIIDHRRKGFNKDSKFYQKLEPIIRNELKKIIDNLIKEARKSGEIFNPKNIKDALKEINRIAKNILESKIPTAPSGITTDYLTFYYRGLNKVEIKEAEEQGILLLVNTKNVPEGSLISIKCSNPDILVEPTKIKVTKQDTKSAEKDYVINLLGKKADIVAKLMAVTSKNKKTTIDVIVNRNPRLYPQNGFQFIPEEKKLAIDETEVASLIAGKEVLKNSSKVIISSSNKSIECLNSEINLASIKRLNKISPFHNVFELKVHLKGKDLDQKGKITAICGKKECNLTVKVVTPIEKATYGLFKGIEIKDFEDIKDVSFEREGILFVNKAHPVIKRYTIQTNYSKDLEYQTLVSNIVTQQICKTVVDKKREEQKLPILDIQNPENILDAVNSEYRDLYYEHGHKFNEIIMILFKKE